MCELAERLGWPPADFGNVAALWQAALLGSRVLRDLTGSSWLLTGHTEKLPGDSGIDRAGRCQNRSTPRVYSITTATLLRSTSQCVGGSASGLIFRTKLGALAWLYSDLNPKLCFKLHLNREMGSLTRNAESGKQQDLCCSAP
jgi:hypothetical protein